MSWDTNYRYSIFVSNIYKEQKHLIKFLVTFIPLLVFFELSPKENLSIFFWDQIISYTGFHLEQQMLHKLYHNTSVWIFFKMKGFGKSIQGTAIRAKSNKMICKSRALLP